jgi:hypothetical protein
MNFVEVTSNNNWFKQHPEKIAGVEFTTTSIFFPIQVKGTKEDVLRVTGMSEKNILDKTRKEFIDEMVFYTDVFNSYPSEITDTLKIVRQYKGNQFNLVKPTKTGAKKYAGIVYDYHKSKQNTNSLKSEKKYNVGDILKYDKNNTSYYAVVVESERADEKIEIADVSNIDQSYGLWQFKDKNLRFVYSQKDIKEKYGYNFKDIRELTKKGFFEPKSYYHRDGEYFVLKSFWQQSENGKSARYLIKEAIKKQRIRIAKAKAKAIKIKLLLNESV